MKWIAVAAAFACSAYLDGHNVGGSAGWVVIGLLIAVFAE